MCTSCFAVALGKSGYRKVTPHCAVKGFPPPFLFIFKGHMEIAILCSFFVLQNIFPLKYVARILHLHRY